MHVESGFPDMLLKELFFFFLCYRNGVMSAPANTDNALQTFLSLLVKHIGVLGVQRPGRGFDRQCQFAEEAN